MEKISWETVEYLHTHKTTDWYWIVGAIAVSISLIAIIMNNPIFAILVIISAFTLTLFASRPSNIINIEIGNSGIIIGKTHHNYSELESFWIEMDDPNPKIILKSKKVFMPFITIFIEHVHPDDIHQILSMHLKEEKHVEPFIEKLLIYLGF